MLISTDALTKRYGNVLALDALSVEVPDGVIGLLGPNGAGKTTLFKILLGLIEPSSGRATIKDHDILPGRDGNGDRRALAGYMPEHDCLPGDVSAVNFITHLAQVSGLPYGAARERTAEVLRHVGLLEERHREIGTFSTGMKQRAKLAQALVHDPALLLLDEPTNGLDPAGRLEMLDLIRMTGRELQISIVMSSHLLDDVERVCDEIVVIDNGRLIRSGPLGDFVAETAVLSVETDGGEAELAAALNARGYEAVLDGAAVLLDLTSEEVYDGVLAAISDSGLPLIRMERKRRSLTELFSPPEDGADG